MSDPGDPDIVEWAVASSMLQGQPESGDSYLVRSCPGGVLAAVVDGLGHGNEAATAARLAVEVLEAASLVEPLAELVRRCHKRLARTRGVAMTVALFDPRGDTMTWLGVGNVQGVLVPAKTDPVRRPESVLLRSGVVGFKLPQTRASSVRVHVGDTLVLATDGIRDDFGSLVTPHDPPQRIADSILARCGRHTDDALVLIVRYVGSRP